MPTTKEPITACPFPRRQYKPNSMGGKKHAAYRLPEKDVRETMPPGGFRAMSAVISANSAT